MVPKHAAGAGGASNIAASYSPCVMSMQMIQGQMPMPPQIAPHTARGDEGLLAVDGPGESITKDYGICWRKA